MSFLMHSTPLLQSVLLAVVSGRGQARVFCALGKCAEIRFRTNADLAGHRTIERVDTATYARHSPLKGNPSPALLSILSQQKQVDPAPSLPSVLPFSATVTLLPASFKISLRNTSLNHFAPLLRSVELDPKYAIEKFPQCHDSKRAAKTTAILGRGVCMQGARSFYYMPRVLSGSQQQLM